MKVGDIVEDNTDVFGFNDAKEKVPIYSKGDYAIITTQVVANENSNKQGHTYIKFPDGFTLENTIVLSAMYSFNAEFMGGNPMNAFRSTTSGMDRSELYVQLGDVSYEMGDNSDKVISVYFYPAAITANAQMVYVRLVLMKMSNVIEDVRPIKVGDNLVGGSDNLIYFDMNPISNDDAENNRVIITGTNGTIFERVNGQQVQLVMSSEGDEEVIGGKGGSGLIVCGTAITYGIGVVTSVNTESPYYHYIRIKENND